MEEFFTKLLIEYGYIILFVWCIMEGEMALIMAGILSHQTHMHIALAIFVAGLGGFVGDQIYFYLGRYNKKYIAKKLHTQRRKFAIAHIMLKKYGWPIIFIQRYMYGFRVIIPLTIGLTGYSAKKYALINLISAWCWATITIIPAWVLGEHILDILHKAKEHWYVAVPIVAVFLGALLYGFKRIENKILNERKHRSAVSNNK